MAAALAFWSPTVDYVLRKASCEVMVIAYPEGVLEAAEEGDDGAPRRHSGYAGRVKAIVIGCGRVGSNVAKALHRDGWDVTVVDEKEEALTRLGEDWPGRFIVGHGMEMRVLRAAGIDDAEDPPRPSSSPPTATTRTS